ncbi:MAG: hypothetical protein IJR93_01180 [Treponema sp.]|nr:hypothetical protein [Treponema sp.]MBQ7165545.1 hypothetical protein [Treponema sp.]
MTAMKGYVRGNTVVVENDAINAYDGYEVEIRLLGKKSMSYEQACQELMELEGSGIWEGDLDTMREDRCLEL